MAAKNFLDDNIGMAHERLIQAMEDRLPGMNLETKERYFAVLSILVSKLESADKNLRDVLAEMMSEAMSHILEELNSA